MTDFKSEMREEDSEYQTEFERQQEERLENNCQGRREDF